MYLTAHTVEVPHPTGIINKSGEEEVNCCNQLIKSTPSDGECFYKAGVLEHQ